MSYNWSELESIFQESLNIPKDQRATFIKHKTAGNKALEDTLLLMLKDSEKAEEYFYDLQETIARGIDTEQQKVYQENEIIGKFRVKKLLGKGGMGTVYLGERADGEFEQTVAIKCLTAKAATESFLKHFKQEQQILAKLKHPSIAQLFDGGITEDGTRYIIMELIEGKPIDEYVNEKQLSEKQIIKYFITIAQAVQAAHSQLVLHQDIKPGNILVDNNGSVKLLDFGIAQVISESSPSTEAFKGTPHYAAPEQVKNETISTATDIYQLGTLLHKLVTKRLPFSKISESGVKNIAIAHEQLNWELSSIIEKCLQANPEDRYQAVTELIDDLNNYLNNYPVSTLPSNFKYRTKKYFQRNIIASSVTLLVFIVLISATAFSYQQAEIAKQERDKARRTNDFIEDLFVSSSPIAEGKNYRELSVFEFLNDKKQSLFENDNITDDTKWELLQLLYNTYLNLPETSEGINVANEMFSLAQTANNPQWEAVSTYLLGHANALSYNFDLADSLFSKAYDNLEELRAYDKETATFFLSNYGLSLTLQHQYDSAALFFQKAMQYCAQHEFKSNDPYYETYHYYSQVKRAQKEYDSALLLATKVIDLKQQDHGADHLRLVSDYSDRALIYMDLADYNAAEKDLRKAMDIGFPKLDTTVRTMEIVVSNYASLLTLEERHAEAATINQGLMQANIEKSGFYDGSVVYNKYQLVKNYIALRDFKAARKQLSEGYHIIDSLGGRLTYMKGLFFMEEAVVDLHQNNPEKALLNIEASEAILGKMGGHYNYFQYVQKARKGMTLKMLGQAAKGQKLIQSALVELQKQDQKLQRYVKEAQHYLETESVAMLPAKS